MDADAVGFHPGHGFTPCAGIEARARADFNTGTPHHCHRSRKQADPVTTQLRETHGQCITALCSVYCMPACAGMTAEIGKTRMPSPRRIDVHFHLIPPFYRDAVYAAGRGPAIGKYPDWTPQLALEVMDRFGIAVALTSLAQPGVGFGTPTSAQELARRCNDYAAELTAHWPD